MVLRQLNALYFLGSKSCLKSTGRSAWCWPGAADGSSRDVVNQRQRRDVGVSDTEVWSKMAVMIVNHCILVYPVPSDSIPDFPTNRAKAVFVAHSVFLFIWIWCSISNLDPYANCVDCLQGLLNKPKSRETSCNLSFSGAWEGWDSWASQGGTQTWGEGKEPSNRGAKEPWVSVEVVPCWAYVVQFIIKFVKTFLRMLLMRRQIVVNFGVLGRT